MAKQIDQIIPIGQAGKLAITDPSDKLLINAEYYESDEEEEEMAPPQQVRQASRADNHRPRFGDSPPLKLAIANNGHLSPQG